MFLGVMPPTPVCAAVITADILLQLVPRALPHEAPLAAEGREEATFPWVRWADSQPREKAQAGPGDGQVWSEQQRGGGWAAWGGLKHQGQAQLQKRDL